MPKKPTPIPVNAMAGALNAGISIERLAFKDLRIAGKETVETATQSHRHDRHSFFLLEKGTVSIEIDFKKYTIKPNSVIYIHPNQVHRTTASKNVLVSCWAINNENLHPAYLKLLEDITPVKPLPLKKEIFSLISDAVSLCLKFSERENDKLYHFLLKDSCNALVALVTSQYLEQTASTEKSSRFEIVNKAFRELLESDYTTVKRPAAYARKLHLSAAYLNECVKNTTGYSVSYHLQQRVILEAKRLLYYADKPVKEIAIALGYDDYHYFSRLFTKIAGMAPLTFRNKNRG